MHHLAIVRNVGADDVHPLVKRDHCLRRHIALVELHCRFPGTAHENEHRAAEGAAEKAARCGRLSTVAELWHDFEHFALFDAKVTMYFGESAI